LRLTILIAILCLVGCGGEAEISSSESSASLAEEVVSNENAELRHVLVDEAVIESGDIGQIVAPVGWAVNFYDELSDYEASLQPFSQPQRDVFLVVHYLSEMQNGGHYAFFGQDGICWPETLEALDRTGLDGFAALLRSALKKFSLPPSRDYEEREEQLERASPDFETLDDRFYEILDNGNTDATLLQLVERNRADFLFDGQVVVPEY